MQTLSQQRLLSWSNYVSGYEISSEMEGEAVVEVHSKDSKDSKDPVKIEAASSYPSTHK